MRILQFITPAGLYGAERWVLALANNIGEESLVCDLAVTRESTSQDLTVAEVFPREKGGRVHYLDMNGPFDLRVVSQLCTVIRERKINVIHTHGYKSDILGLLAARRTGVACVSTPHGFPGTVSLKMGAFIKVGTYVLRHFDQVAPLSEDLVADMHRFGVPNSKVTFIRNGVDLKEIDTLVPEESRKQRIPDDVKRIGFVGQMIPRKGIDDLLDVFDELHRADSFLRLELLGDGSQRSELETHAAALQSSDAISFLGFRSDRLERLSQFDLFVMTSSLEGIPRCMMEAMAVGVPVVAYDIPGVDKLIDHEQTGLLAPLGDKQALADCCRRVLEDSELTAELTKNARKKIDEEYSAARMAKEYEALFARLLGQPALGDVSQEKAL